MLHCLKRRPLTWLAVLAFFAGCRGAESRYASRLEEHGEDARLADARMTQGMDTDESLSPASRQAGLPPTFDRNTAPGGRAMAEPSVAEFNAAGEHLAQARIENARGNLDQAKLHYRRVLQDVPNQFEAHHRLAVIADRQQNFNEAETHYLAALRVRPQDANLHSDLGYSFLLQGKLGEAEQALNQALKIDPVHSRAMNNLGLLYGRQGDYDRAYATFLRTSSEQEAQQKMARIFPEAGGSTAPNRGANETTSESLAGQRRPNSPAMIDTASYDASPASNGLNDDPNNGYPSGMRPGDAGVNADPSMTAANSRELNDLTQRIKGEMERVRREAEMARQQKSGLAAMPGAGRLPTSSPATGYSPGQRLPTRDESPHAELAARQPSAQPMRNSATMGHSIADRQAPEPARNRLTRSVADRDLSARFAAIDQSGANAMSSSTSIAAYRRQPNSPTDPAAYRESGVATPPSNPTTRFTQGAANEREPRRQRAANSGQNASEDVWPPAGQVRNNLIVPAQYSNSTGGSASPQSRIVPTAAQLEAQRMATRIGMEAGPGGMFSYLDHNPAMGGTPPRAQSQRDPQNERLVRAGGAGYVPDLSAPPSNAPWNGQPHSQPGRPDMPPVDQYRVDQYNGGASYGHPAGNGYDPMPGPQGGHQPMPEQGRAWRQEGVAYDDDPTMSSSDPSAINMSYQDHANQMRRDDPNAFVDSEYQAILQQLRRNERLPPSSQMNRPMQGADAPPATQQYYAPMDSQIQVYEEMRAASREGYQAKPGQRQNPTGMHEGTRASVGYGEGPGYGHPSPMRGVPPRAASGMPTGVSPWGNGIRP